jgi:putative acetyltransferase
LVLAGLAACADAGGEFVVVLGEPSYYRRFGFQNASLLGIANEYGVDDEFMIAPLCAESLAPGLAKYASEFADVSTTH